MIFQAYQSNHNDNFKFTFQWYVMILYVKCIIFPIPNLRSILYFFCFDVNFVSKSLLHYWSSFIINDYIICILKKKTTSNIFKKRKCSQASYYSKIPTIHLLYSNMINPSRRCSLAFTLWDVILFFLSFFAFTYFILFFLKIIYNIYVPLYTTLQGLIKTNLISFLYFNTLFVKKYMK